MRSVVQVAQVEMVTSLNSRDQNKTLLRQNTAREKRSTMQISLLKDPQSKAGEILVHVEVSASDDPPEFVYSHSFKYKIPSDTNKEDGKIIVFADKITASSDMHGKSYPFRLEKCHNKKCKAENKDGCP